MTGPDANPWQPPQPDAQPAAQAPSYPGYGAPPPYGAPPQGWQPQPWGPQSGPPGAVRPTGKCILLFVVTIAIYTYVYNYKVHKEMKEHSGRGVGGGVALLLTFLAGVAMPFVTSAEVGSLYARRGEREPVRGWTGLWLLLPAVGGYVVLIIAMISVAATADPAAPATDAEAISFVVAFLLYAIVAIAGGVVWFVKTNGALNRYWESVGGR